MMAEVVSWSELYGGEDEALVDALYDGLHSYDCLCAWCLRAAQEKPREGDSHGICQYHREETYSAWQESRRARRGR